MKTKLFKPPFTDSDKFLGKTVVQPLDLFSANGYRWSRTLTWKIQSLAVPCGNTLYRTYFLANPTYGLDKFRITTEDGKPCRCKECLAGVRLVKKGWSPDDETEKSI